MKVILDHHMEGHGILLWSIMENEGWLKLIDIPMLTFAEIGVPVNAPDREVWRFAQEQQLILLTANRNDEGEDSLEQTIREENKPASLPVLTIGILDRMKERTYREKCAEKIVDIVLNIENYLGAGRIYIP
jgi:hypothetical protein